MTDYLYPIPDLRTQILSFKVIHLQTCAGRLGISKSGKKAEVQNRLLCYFGLNPTTGPGDISPAVQGKLELSARIIKDVYYQSRGITRNPSTSPGPGGGGPSSATPNGTNGMNGAGVASTSATAAASNPLIVKLHTKLSPGVVVRCICKNSSYRSGMVQCSEPSCRVWQHADCVREAANNHPTDLYCEQCRVHLADPFWKPLEQLLPVAKLKPAVGVPPIRDSYNELHAQQSTELTVYLSEQQLSKGKNLPDSERIIASCLLLEDPVACRVHWPRNVTMRVNRYPYRAYGRSATSKMGINQRDEVANIASLCLAGRNTLDIQAVENGSWLILLHRVEARTVNQVKEMMLPMESSSDAIARVKKLMHDDDLSIASQIVSLIDPWSGQRMATPARFINASGLQAFDLDSFLSLAQRNRKWQDPTTLKNSTVRQLQVDTYMKIVLSILSAGGGSGGGGSGSLLEVREIVINDEGKWRPEGTDEASLRWFSIEEDEELVKKELKEFYSSGGGGGGVKSPGGGGGGKVANAPNGGGGDSEGVFLSDTESDEEEELRKAAAAVMASAAVAAEAGKKRKAESQPEPEVICLLSDSDDDNGGGGFNTVNRSVTHPPALTGPQPGPPPQQPFQPQPFIQRADAAGPTADLLRRGERYIFHNTGNPGSSMPQVQRPVALLRMPGRGSVRPPPNYPSSHNFFGNGGRGRGTGGVAQNQTMVPFSRMPPQARPPPPPPQSYFPQNGSSGGGGGGAGRVLSQSAQEALEETLAAINGNPSLMDQVNQDDW
jgi:hypothetical protein